MSVIRDLLEGAAILSAIGGGAGLLVLYGRDRTAANVHDLSDYHDEPTAELEPRRHNPDLAVTADAFGWVAETERAALTGPVGLAAWEATTCSDGPVPPLARALMVELAVPTLSDAAIRATADDMLREIAAEQQAKAGIVRVVSPATDRDYTGAFPVVAVA